MQKITPCLWFDNEAEEAANFYTSLFDDGKILKTTHFTAETPSNKPIGSVLTVSFQIAGQEFMALNGGPEFKFNESISFVINCETQAEIDELWQKLSADLNAEACGWLKDKYGMSWQIVPSIMDELVDDADREKSARALKALLEMKKLDIAKLKAAYEGK